MSFIFFSSKLSDCLDPFFTTWHNTALKYIGYWHSAAFRIKLKSRDVHKDGVYMYVVFTIRSIRINYTVNKTEEYVKQTERYTYTDRLMHLNTHIPKGIHTHIHIGIRTHEFNGFLMHENLHFPLPMACIPLSSLNFILRYMLSFPRPSFILLFTVAPSLNLTYFRSAMLSARS